MLSRRSHPGLRDSPRCWVDSPGLQLAVVQMSPPSRANSVKKSIAFLQLIFLQSIKWYFTYRGAWITTFKYTEHIDCSRLQPGIIADGAMGKMKQDKCVLIRAPVGTGFWAMAFLVAHTIFWVGALPSSEGWSARALRARFCQWPGQLTPSRSSSPLWSLFGLEM